MTTLSTRMPLFKNGTSLEGFFSKKLSFSLTMLPDALSIYEGAK